jgi:BirA family biotin operon repressor/biotin-[acetyl-CoA-carboxylase] ligase
MKDRLLEYLAAAHLAGPDFVSGAELGQVFGVSRAAISKAVQSLTAAGIPIQSVKHRGYRLAEMPDRLLAPLLTAAFRTGGLNSLASVVRAFATVDSTNLAARRGAAAGDPSGTLYIAETQTAGRGRRGNSWLSDAGAGLWFSLLLRPDLPPERLALITLFAGLCTAEALRAETGLDIRLKWPNDLILWPDGKKAGGILTEMLLEENCVTAVILGIGINVRSKVFPPELRDRAASLETAQPGLSRIGLLTAILRHLEQRGPDFLQDPAAGWLDAYRALCVTLDRPVRVHEAGGLVWDGRAVGLAAGGDLLVQTPDGLLTTVTAGEVSVRGLMGYL